MIDPKLLASLRSFELTDAVLSSPERRTLVRLSFVPVFPPPLAEHV